MGDSIKNNQNDNVPVVLRFWTRMHQSIPKVYIPGTRMDISFTICSFILFSSLSILSHKLFREHLLWDPQSLYTSDSAACLISILHSSILVVSLFYLIISQSQSFVPSANMSSAPQWWNDSCNALMQFCTGYMIYDSFGMVIKSGWTIHPDDLPIVAHHVVTTTYMTQARLLGTPNSALLLMFTGELTAPFMNLHWIARFGMKMHPPGSWYHNVAPYIEFTYSILYTLMRAIIGPIVICYISYDLLFTAQGRKNVPLYISIIWVILIWGVILGSLPWTFEAIEMAKDGLKLKYDADYNYGPRYEL